MATKFPTQAGLAGHTFANIDGAGETHRNWMAAVGGRLTRVVDVKVDFGAVGDGSTDDSAAIQAALNTFGSQGFYGPTIYFPQGVYYCATGLTCANVGLKMVGEGSSGIDPIIGQGPVQILVGNSQWGLTLGSGAGDQFSGYYIEGILFKEKNAGLATGGVRLLRVSNATLQNVCAGSFTAGTGFLSDGTGDVCQYNTFIDCRVGECKFGYDEINTNGTRWIGGIFQAMNGPGSPVSGSIGMRSQSSCDTFRAWGSIIQGFETDLYLAGIHARCSDIRFELWSKYAVRIAGTGIYVSGSGDNSLIGFNGVGVQIESGSLDCTDSVSIIDITDSTLAHVDFGTRTRFPQRSGTTSPGPSGLGNVIGRQAVYDNDNNILGYTPIYDNIVGIQRANRIGRFVSSSSSVTSFTITATAPIPVGEQIIIGGGYSQSSTPSLTITDSRSNSYTVQANGLTTGFGTHSYVATARVATAIQVGDVFTITHGAAVQEPHAFAFRFSNVATSSFVDGSSTGATGTSTAVASGNITTTATDDLVFATIFWNVSGSAAIVPTAPFILIDSITSTNYVCAVMWRPAPTATTYNSQGTLSGSSTWSISAMALKHA